MVDGRFDVDSNMIERQMRPIGISRRNSLFAGNEGGAKSWAVCASLLQTAKLNGLDPFTWLNDVLTRIVSGEVKSNDRDQLLARPNVPCERKIFKSPSSQATKAATATGRLSARFHADSFTQQWCSKSKTLR